MKIPFGKKGYGTILLGMLGLLLLASVLIVTLTVPKVKADDSFIPEPDPRPEGVPDYIVWDSVKGEYVRKGYTREEQAEADAQALEYAGQHMADPDPADERLAELGRSDDPIDRAIYICATYPEEVSIYSSTGPNDSEAVLAGIREIPISAYPAVWERACTEPAGRALKLAALEKFLGISSKWGLFDVWAQEQWYNDFTKLKHSLPTGEATGEDAARFGRLLIPQLKSRLEDGTLTEAETAILAGLLGENVPTDAEGLGAALDKNAETVSAIEEILANDYGWVKQSVLK